MWSSSINTRMFWPNRLTGCKPRGRNETKTCDEDYLNYFMKSVQNILWNHSISFPFEYITEQKIAFDLFVTVDSVASESRFEIGLNVQEDIEAQTRGVSIMSSSVGHEVAPPEQIEKKTERKQSMAAQPVTPSRTRKTAVCPQLYEIWCFLLCLLVPKDMFVIATSLTTTLKQHFLRK